MQKLKVAIVNKFFFVKGGQESLMIEEAKLLEKAGHEVAFFSMHHKKNPPYKYDKYFVDYAEYSNLGKEYSLSEKIQLAQNFIYNKQAAINFENFISDFKPDIIHCHGIAHQITLSILPVAKKYNIPVAQTLHDCQVICPSYSLLISSKSICKDVKCLNHKYYNCILNKCVKSSFTASFLSTMEMYFNYKLNNFTDCISKFVIPSTFLTDLVIKSGINQDRIVNIPNFINNIETKKPKFTNKGYFLYVGRLSFEKGLFTLLKAFKSIPEVNLVIVGAGPLEKDLIKFKGKNRLKNVSFVGFKMDEELEEYFNNCKAVILPSECYENAPMTIIEAFSHAKPVISTNIGGIPEMVKDGINGYLFEYKNIDDLKEKVLLLDRNDDFLMRLGQNARDMAVQKYSGVSHLNQLLDLYSSILNQEAILISKKEAEVTTF